METPELAFDEGTLVLRNMPYENLKSAFPDKIWKWDPRADVWRIEALRYSEVKTRLDKNGWTFLSADHPQSTDAEFDQATSEKAILDNVPSWNRVIFPSSRFPPFRPEQKKAARAWVDRRKGVLVMPTGSGKTEVALALMKKISMSTLIVAPIRDLMYQWQRRILSTLHYDAGIVGDGQFDVRPVTVTTYDSACIHMNRLGDWFYFVIFDECHHLPGRFLREAALMSAAPARLGLTATPERADGLHKALDQLIGPVAYRVSLSSIRGDSLADYEIVRVPVHLSHTEQARYDHLSKKVANYMHASKSENKNFTWKDLLSESADNIEAREIQKAYYIKKSIESRAEEKFRVLEDIFRLHLGSRVIVFAGTNAMAREISLRFLIPCILSHCKKDERNDILNGFAERKYPAIVANRVLDEGIDVPEAKVAVVLGGLGSTRQAIQRLGRILRKSGNENAVLYEVVCESTKEVEASRRRRRSRPYEKVKRKFRPVD